MNVIVTNKYKEMLMSLDIEVIKSMDGVFEVDQIIDSFQNFYFDKMILDITAIKDYENLDNLQKLSMSFDMEKIILLLEDTPLSNSKGYLSKLISMGIYNFTRNLEGINYLLVHSNTYKDVVNIHDLADDDVDENGNPIKPGTTIAEYIEAQRLKVIGIKNVTEHAGATSLTYILKKHLESNYKVVAVEVDKREFIYFNDDALVSTTKADLPKEFMKYNNYEVMLVDLNDYDDLDVCTEVLYLVEPSMLKLNKLIKRNRNTFSDLKDKKIVLNRCGLTETDVAEFEYEAKANVFYKLPFIDERKKNNVEVNKLLVKLGFIKQNPEEMLEANKKNILGMFKF